MSVITGKAIESKKESSSYFESKKIQVNAVRTNIPTLERILKKNLALINCFCFLIMNFF